jgi:hypothetical protein
MNRFQAMAMIMAKLTTDCYLKPASAEYKLARKLAAELIDLIGPAAAARKVTEAGTYSLDRLERLCIQLRIVGNFPSRTF